MRSGYPEQLRKSRFHGSVGHGMVAYEHVHAFFHPIHDET
jgi:hypothetical protein